MPALKVRRGVEQRNQHSYLLSEQQLPIPLGTILGKSVLKFKLLSERFKLKNPVSHMMEMPDSQCSAGQKAHHQRDVFGSCVRIITCEITAVSGRSRVLCVTDLNRGAFFCSLRCGRKNFALCG